MRFLAILVCATFGLEGELSSTQSPTQLSEPCCEHAPHTERPVGDAKNWGCSNHTPQHLASAREIPELTSKEGCRGWKRVR